MKSRIRNRLAVAGIATLIATAFTLAGGWGTPFLFPYTGWDDLLPLILLCATIVGGIVACRCLRSNGQKWSIIGTIIGAGLGLVLSYLLMLVVFRLGVHEWAIFLENDAFMIGLIIIIPLLSFFSGAYLGMSWDPLKLKTIARKRLRYKLPVLNLCMILFMGLIYWSDYYFLFDNMILKFFNPILFYPFENFVYAIFEFREAIGYLPEDLSKGIHSSFIVYSVLVLIIGTIQWYVIGIIYERFVIVKSRQSLASH